MQFYVYIIQSVKDSSYYKGFSEDPYVRLLYHNRGKSKYTSTKMPWKLIYVEAFETKKEALIREKTLKKYSNEQIVKLSTLPKNIVSQFSVG